MANAWPQRALGPWTRAKKNAGPSQYRRGTDCWVGIALSPFFCLAHGPKALCGHVLAMFGHI